MRPAFREKFLIIRLSSLGDIIHTLPAFSALRRKFPEAKISWIVEEKGKEILELVPGINDIVVFPRKGWRKKIRNRNQIALDFQGLLKSAFLAFLSGARRRIGFHRHNLKEPMASLFYTESPGEVHENQHVIWKNLRLLEKIGVKENQLAFPLQIPPEIQERVRGKLKEIGFERGKKLILLNVGAGWETKRWFAEKWAELAAKIQRENSFYLLLWGDEREKELAFSVSERTKVPLAPFFSIKETLALLQESSLLVSGDTFALQAASALSTPVVGIFGPTNPRRNGPFSEKDPVAFHELNCSFCYKRTCSHLECLKRISPQEVAALVFSRLRENG